MTGKGRGDFLKMLSERSASSAKKTVSDVTSSEDSGMVSQSGEYRRLGRGKLLDDLTSSCSALSLGRARGTLLKSEPPPLAAGAGRAFLFEKLQKYDSGPRETSASSPKITSQSSVAPLEKREESKQEQPAEQKFVQNLKSAKGVKGKPIQVACNYIRLQSDPNKGVYVYEVRFSPNVDSSSLRMRYLNEHRQKFGGVKTFDGVTLYLPILLPEKLTTYVSHNAADGSEIEIRVLFKRKETMGQCIHLYNVLFDRVMKSLHYVRFDRKQYDPTSPKIIPQQKLELWPGYVTAVDEHEGGLLLCCDVSHRLLYQKTVYEILTEIQNINPGNYQEMAKKAILGSVVITRYNNRTYRIDDICFDKSPRSTFPTGEGNVTYNDYYLKHHNINIRDKSQPLLMSIKKQKHVNTGHTEDVVFCLIPEICFLTGLRDDMRSDFRLMREIAAHTRISPNQRMDALRKFYTNINKSPEAKQILKDWGLSLQQSHEVVQARSFAEEQIYFGLKTLGAGPHADFSRYATNNELLDVVHMHNWLLLHCKKDTRIAQEFIEHVERCTRPLGMKVQKPKIVMLSNDRVDTFVNGLRENLKKDTQIVVIISPTNRDDRYAAIKKICCAEIPVPSQVINAQTLSNESKNRSIVQKIVLQMNCKLGGSLWSVKIPFQNVMICGIDSYHDAGQRNNSVAAFVASLNSTYSKWYSKAIIQTKREEIVNALTISLVAAMVAYQKENDKYPDNVIIYRDGVGDGQLPLCQSYEVKQFEQACLRSLNCHIKLTFIVTQKRINTRYFEMFGSQMQNPAPGTVVDTTVTRANYYDFFLVSQSVRQGTVSPTHYVVLRDDANYSPDILQRLTYKLCFLYYNWPGTIRIPACCQYAHKMASLVGQSMRRAPAEELATKLFYL